MAHFLLREQVIQLRYRGYTYGQIRRELGVPKATLSNWLANLPLSLEQQTKLLQNKALSKDLSREKFIETFKKRRQLRLQEVLNVQIRNLVPLSKRELFLTGVFLYWGEGSKQHGLVSISNTNPQVLLFVKRWMVEALEIPKDQLKIALHLYKDMNILQEMYYWSELLDLPLSQFRKPYIKKTNREGLTYKSYGHGTCNLYVSSVVLSEMIAMSIKAISNPFGAKDEVFWYN